MLLEGLTNVNTDLLEFLLANLGGCTSHAFFCHEDRSLSTYPQDRGIPKVDVEDPVEVYSPRYRVPLVTYETPSLEGIQMLPFLFADVDARDRHGYQLMCGNIVQYNATLGILFSAMLRPTCLYMLH